MGTSLSAVGKATRPLRVGYLVQQFPPEVGAGAARVGEMAERWQDKGTVVTIFTGMPNRPEGRIHKPYRGRLFFKEEWHGITVRRSWLYASPKHGMGRTLLNNLSFMTTSGFDVARYAGRLDVLIASSPPFFPHISGTLIAATRRVPLILEVRDLWPDYLAEMGHLNNASARRMLFGLERRLLHRADHVVTVTEALKKRLLEKGLPAEKITIIPNGVDPSLYYKSAEPAPLSDLRSDRSKFTVGYLGNFGAGQALEVVVRAAELLQRQKPQVRVVMAGDGTEGQTIHRLAASLGVNNLTIHPPVAKDRTRAFYNACDVCLVPLAPLKSLAGALPTKLFESLACERPVIASVEGESAALIEGAKAGMVVPPGDAPALASAIQGMQAISETERAEMGRRGREAVIARFSRAAGADRFLELLTLVAGRSPRRSADD
ncbi:MAG TPA: glycosyltransferase family 4 protein [Gemmatimonadales bacterium]|nr:glycosyltransferase family 4 protein [Gemmatimonadales bacterium]